MGGLGTAFAHRGPTLVMNKGVWSLFVQCEAAKERRSPRILLNSGTSERITMFQTASGLHSSPTPLFVIYFYLLTQNSCVILASSPIRPLFSAPVFDYEDIPSPLSETESTITVLLRPALARGAPVR